MPGKLFEIRNLVCGYKNAQGTGRKVLYIEDLCIDRGTMLFLLGASGAGKSTFLEALGLMNNTIAEGELLFYPEPASAPINIASLWKQNDQKGLASVRKQHFSFIFQNTNLMENFTAYENVSLSRMIQEQSTHSQASHKAIQLLRKVGLNAGEVHPQTKAVNLSGGQRQRLAFVRALNVDYTVLFGDEPTGNLDDEMAVELFGIIKDKIKGDQSAIIVTHNIDLALHFADQICVITKAPEELCGRIKKENVFERNQWAASPAAFKTRLQALYHAGDTMLEQAPREDKPVEAEGIDDDRSTFRRLFLRRESMALAGKRFQNLLIMVAMLCFTFLAIGFANGGLAYLKIKLENPIVNWLDVVVPYTATGRIEEMKEDMFLLAEEENPYNLEGVNAYANVHLEMADYESLQAGRVQSYTRKGRSIEISDVEKEKGLLSDILSKENLVVGTGEGFANDYEFSFIVTEELLRGLKYDLYAPFMWMRAENSFASAQDPDQFIEIPVRAVVRDIPGKNDFMVTPCFLKAYFDLESNVFDITKYGDIDLFLEGSKEEASALKGHIESFFETEASLKYRPFVDPPKEYSLSHIPGYSIHVELTSPFPDSVLADSLDQLFQRILSYPPIASQSFNIHRIYPMDYSGSCVLSDPDMLSFYFLNLDRVNDFADYLKKTYNPENAQDPIEVDTAKVEEKQNFNFLSKVTKVVAWLLVLFSVVSISLFTSNLLKMHLSKIGMNIGTYKAFGLSNRKALLIYLQIILGFVGVGIIFGIILAQIFGTGIEQMLLKQLNVEAGIVYFQLFGQLTILTLAIIVIFTILVSRWTIQSMLNKTPGDLVYKR